MSLWGKDILKTKFVGQVYKDQLSSIKKEMDVLDRIASKCENCNGNEFYNIYKNFRIFRLLGIPLVQCDSVYFFSCPECNFGFKLEAEEFGILEQIALLNSKYLNSQITKSEFEIGLRSIGNKG